MSGDGVPTTKFWQSGTFWSLAIAAAMQVLQAALAPESPLHFAGLDSLSTETVNTLQDGTFFGSLGAVFAALCRRTVAKGPLLWRF
jgi:hypothetical protein